MNEYLRRIDKRDYLTEREHREYLEKLNAELQELEYQKRKNADLLETINCIKKHAMIKRTKGLGTEIIVSFHSNDNDFEKVGWVFDIVK